MLSNIALNKFSLVSSLLILSFGQLLFAQQQIAAGYLNTFNAPSNLHFQNLNSHSVEIDWDRMDGLQYEVRYRIEGETGWNELTADSKSALDIDKLKPKTKYEVQVKAFNDDGESVWSQSGSFESKPPPGGPNMLIIYLDDSRYDCFGATGGPPFLPTPAIDRIANEGVNFKYCFPALSLCEPSRCSIMTGKYPHHTGLYNNGYEPDFNQQTVAPILHDQGYYIGFVGKYGFKKFPNPGYDYYCESSSDPYVNAKYDYNGLNNYQINGHKTTVFTDKALEFLESVPEGNKWVLYVAHKAPHVPLDPRTEEEGMLDAVDIPVPDNYSHPYSVNAPSYYNECNHEKYSQTVDEWKDDYRKYYELIAGAEWSVDTILQYLDDHNLTDSTLILFTSDNGLLIGEHFLSGKEIALEESIRLPMFIRYPAWFPAGTKIDSEMAMNIDIGPTMLDAAGLPDTFGMDGMSIRKLYDGSAHRKELFYEYFNRDPTNCNPTFTAIRDFKYEYITGECTTVTDEFYDLTLDSLMNYNLINDPTYAALVDEYKAKLEDLKIQYDYTNIRDTVLSCFLDSVDSSVIDTSVLLGIHPPIQSSFADGQLTIFPNPTSSALTVDLLMMTDNAEISIFNDLSQLIYRESGLESYDAEVTRNINVSKFPAGHYTLTIRCNGKSASIPFIKY